MVGTKISKSAVKRNHIRRRVREIIRLNKQNIKSGFDFTFIARSGALTVDYKELEKVILNGLKKAGLAKN